MNAIVQFTNARVPRRIVQTHKRFSLDEARDLFFMLTGHIKQAMGVVNASAINELMDALDAFQESSLYKHALKKQVNVIRTAVKTQEQKLKHRQPNGYDFFAVAKDAKEGVTRDATFDYYLDVGAFAYKRTKHEIDALREAFLKRLIKEKANFAEIVSRVLTAKALLECSVITFEDVMKDFKKATSVDQTSVFRPFSLQDVYEKVCEFVKLLGRSIDGDGEINFNNDKQIRKTYRVYERALYKDINDATSADEALRANAFLFPKEVVDEYCRDYDEAMKQRQEQKKKKKAV